MKTLAVSLISVILYLVSSSSQAIDDQSECIEPNHPCGNSSTVCLHQKYWCDKVKHCPNGEDEVQSFCRHRGGWEEIFVEAHQQNATEVKPVPRDKCTLINITPPCYCSHSTHLVCSKSRFTNIPTNIPENTTILYLEHNHIEVLGSYALANLEFVTLINMRNCSIHTIQPHAFTNLPSLKKLILESNKLSYITADIFDGLPNLLWLSLQDNNIQGIEAGAFNNLTSLQWLNMHNNQFRWESTLPLPFPLSLEWIDLEKNSMTAVYEDTFAQVPHVTVLLLGSNRINTIEEGAFSYMHDLTDLDISLNQIDTVPPGMLNGTHRLNKFFMADNPLNHIPTKLFFYVPELENINLAGIIIENICKRMFCQVHKLDHITFSAFDYCRYAPHVRNCSPKSDGISSIDNLLDMVVLRVFIWIVAMVTCCGNLIVFFGRLCVKKEEHQTHSFFIKNLCAADFLTGLYLIIVASHDVKFRNEYNRYANDWLSSASCQATGFLAMLGSEVSLLLLGYMSLERFLTIVFPYKFHNIPYKFSVGTVLGIWLTGVVLAAIPLSSESTFGKFYGTNGVCFPLHIHDPYMKGWQYSLAVFLVLNLLAVILISICYLWMFISIMQTRRHAPTLQKGDMMFAKRFFLIVFTDALCWFPIIIIKIMSLAYFTISNEAYAWVAIFVLPVNSALNPILYSLSSISFRRQFSRILHRQATRLRQSFRESPGDDRPLSHSRSYSTHFNKSHDGVVPQQEAFTNGIHNSENIPMTSSPDSIMSPPDSIMSPPESATSPPESATSPHDVISPIYHASINHDDDVECDKAIIISPNGNCVKK